MKRPRKLKYTARKPRTCDVCGEKYHRRNLVEGWDAQNPGRRAGWNKTKVRICTKCMDARQANVMLEVASVKITGTKSVNVPKPKKKEV